MSEWINVDERLPTEMHSDVLLLGSNEFSGEPVMMIDCMADAPTNTTHWMPLPELPQ